jgi:outer membrane receptor protein involved in Fe transport
MKHTEFWKNFRLGEELSVSGAFIYNGLRRFHELKKLDHTDDLFGRTATHRQQPGRSAARWRSPGRRARVDRQRPSRNYSVTEWVDVSYQSSRSTVVPPQNPAYFVTKPYELVDLHFQVDRADGWGLTAGVENLFDRYAELSAQPSDANLITTITAARPRTLLLGVNKRY